MEREEFVVSSTESGDVSFSSAAIAQIVARAALESYGVVGLDGERGLGRLLPWREKTGIEVALRDGGLEIELRLVVEHGLRLSEVATTVRERIRYELERMVGLPVAALEVHIDRVRER